MDTQLKVYDLGGELDVNSTYSDFPVSKRELANILDCSRTTVIKYSDLIWSTSADFRRECPMLNHGGFDREAPLTPFQIWLLSRVAYLMKKLRETRKARIYIKSNPSLFCKARFEKLHDVIKQQIA